MKKVLAFLLVFSLLAVCCGCTGNTDNGNTKPSSATSSKPVVEEDEDVSKEPLVLSGEDEYVVACKKGAGITLDDITEIKGRKVAVVRDTDSEKIGRYYEALVRTTGTDADSVSELFGGSVELIICRKLTAEINSHTDIALDPIVIK